MSAEDQVERLLKDTNRPYNVQGVSDMLATKGVKKAAAERALDALADKGSIVRKEFGKTKVYFPAQEGLAVLAPEESAAAQAEIKGLQERLRVEEETLSTLRKELATASSTLTLNELRAQVGELEAASAALGARLEAAKGGGRTRLSAADVARAEAGLQLMLEAWAKYRRIFRNVWDTVAENLEGKEADLLEEMGVETDKAVGVSYDDLKTLLPPLAKRLKR